MKHKAIILHAGDNVASALADLRAGECFDIDVPGGGRVSVRLSQAIPLGHKFALADIPCGAAVIKYGVPIGQATRDIVRLEHVHTQNLA